MSNLQMHLNLLAPKLKNSALPSRRRRAPTKLPPEVRLLRQSYIAPSRSAHNNKQDVWEATPIDRMFLECDARVDLCWVYSKELAPDALAASLAELMDEFRPFAGRYDPWRKCVRMNDKGLRFQVCQNDAFDLARVRRESHCEHFSPYFIDDCASLLAHARVYFVEEPLMTVRLSMLRGGTGCVVGIRVTHGICDAMGLMRVINRFTEICNGRPANPAHAVLPQAPFPLEFTESAKEIKSKMKAAGWVNVPLTTFVLGVYRNTRRGLSPFNRLRSAPFHVSKAAMERLKAAALCDAHGRSLPVPGTLSANDALSAFICQVLARLFGFEDNHLCGHNVKMDWRGRLPGLDDKFFGNTSSGVLTAQFPAGASLGEICLAINEGLMRFARDPQAMTEHAALNWGRSKYHLAATMADPRTTPMLSSRPSTFIINNLARFPVYPQDFGVGKAELVVPAHSGDEVIIWPRKDNDGVELFFQGPSALAISKLSDIEALWLSEEMSKFERCGDVKAAFEALALADPGSSPPALSFADLVGVQPKPKQGNVKRPARRS